MVMEEAVRDKPRTEADSEPKAAPRRKGPVYMAVWRGLADLSLKAGEPVRALASTKEKEDAMMAIAKFAAIGIQCGKFSLDAGSKEWVSEVFKIPADRYPGFLESHCEYEGSTKECEDPGVTESAKSLGLPDCTILDVYRMRGF